MNEKDFPVVRISRQFESRPEVLFDAWIRPEIVRKWLFKSPVNEITEVSIDPEAGGAFSIVELTETGEVIDHFGRYILVDRPHKLEFSLEVPKHFPGVTEVNLTFGQTAAGGCDLHFVQTGVEPRVVEESWRRMLGQLKELLDK